MNLILLGGPGAGKGTQAEKLVQQFGFKQFSTGDMMRAEMASSSALGAECATYIKAGKLVPDDITNAIVKKALHAQHDQLIFDGYPRTLEQAEALETMLEELGTGIYRVIYIAVDDAVLVDRIANRIVCPVCKRSYHLINRRPQVEGICDFDHTPLVRRSDDTPDKVQVRLSVYKEETSPLIAYFQKKGLLVEIDASRLESEQVSAILEKELSL